MKSHPQIAIGITCWIQSKSELPELERCLESVKDFYPVIVIDGKWDDIEGKTDRSIKEAVEIIKSYQNVIHLVCPDRPEYVNRNAYLEFAGKMACDYLIVLDTDEYCEFPLGREFFIKGLNDIFKDSSSLCSYAHFFDIGRGGNCRMQRIFRYPDKIRAKNKHNEYFSNDVNVYNDILKAPRGLVIHSDKSFRSEYRENIMDKRNKENPIH